MFSHAAIFNLQPGESENPEKLKFTFDMGLRFSNGSLKVYLQGNPLTHKLMDFLDSYNNVRVMDAPPAEIYLTPALCENLDTLKAMFDRAKKYFNSLQVFLQGTPLSQELKDFLESYDVQIMDALPGIQPK